MNRITFAFLLIVVNGLFPACDDGGGSKNQVDTSCLVLQPIRINTRNSAVSVLFGVENCKGEPVPYGTLTVEDFIIGEDGQPLSSETHLEILQGRGQAVFVNLLLDMSDSTRSNLNELISGAKKFISTVLVDKGLDVKIAIQAFDGSAGVVNLQLPSSDVALLNSRLDGLLTYSAVDGASTNLNGALYDSLLALQQSQLAYINRNFNGVSTIGYIVLFTDGGDTAGRVDALITHNNVQAARLTDGTPSSLPPVLTYAVALKGADYDQEALRYLIGGTVGQPNSYVVEADSGSQLEATFARIATRISGQVESTYLLAYCSSKRSGTSTVNIAVKPERAGTANELSFPFSAEGFGPGCDAGYFRTACDGLECGGFNCGGCDDATSRCEGSTLQCTNYCLLFDSCNGETITNPNGYEMVCSFGDEVTECADSCVDTDRDEANCGACGNVCEADGSWCEGGQCLCSGDRIGCGSECVDNLTDVNHCGTCGNVCPAEVACVEGQCQCPGGDVACSGVCLDILTDVGHCGACGNTCAAGATCEGGQCVCNASTPCDGADLHGATCESLSYTAGTLACSSTCEFDVSACRGACGDGVLNPGEDCDGALLNGATCESLGFATGTLVCGPTTFPPDCHYDLSGCRQAFVKVFTGSVCTFGLKTDGTLWAWGSNLNGDLGLGTQTDHEATPVQVGVATDWREISSGMDSTCGTKIDGTLWCWMDSYSNEPSIPAQIGTGTNWSQISEGFYHQCGIHAEGSLWCWGYNGRGQLGIGNTTDQNSPVQVGSGLDWKRIVAFDDSTCGIKVDGSLWCWGENIVGQLGIGNTTNQNSPVRVGTGTDWQSVRSIDSHICGIRADGTLWCWGGNSQGQLGIGNTTNQYSPVQVGTGTDWSQVVAGSRHTCGIRADGTLWCWGGNSDGELGIGNTTPYRSPIQVGTGTDWSQIEVGYYHSCGMKDDQTLWCWGSNQSGYLGLGDTTNRMSPVQVAP